MIDHLTTTSLSSVQRLSCHRQLQARSRSIHSSPSVRTTSRSATVIQRCRVETDYPEPDHQGESDSCSARQQAADAFSLLSTCADVHQTLGYSEGIPGTSG